MLCVVILVVISILVFLVWKFDSVCFCWFCDLLLWIVVILKFYFLSSFDSFL